MPTQRANLLVSLEPSLIGSAGLGKKRAKIRDSQDIVKLLIDGAIVVQIV
jgi:hypothetical protein